MSDSQVNCLYCGKKFDNDAAECPHCGAVSHFQTRGYRTGAKLRFILFCIGVAAFSLFFAFWLPR
ncbi:MAG: protein nirD [Sedimenticola sp.]|uniref:Protein nirD n=1 Tax=Sedimenticola thiotaurini TaxID=1543721 RepID=A0A558CMD5_9GAMM|nr:protein nirD [Sedimenticola sp.]TVT49919.1 MAG: protein nirD [Sedimenticola thiotaurini]